MSIDSDLKQLIFDYAIMKKLVADVTASQLLRIEAVLGENPSFEDLKTKLVTILRNETKRAKVLDLLDLFKDDVKLIESLSLAIKFLRFKEYILKEKSKFNSFELVEEIIKKRFADRGIVSPSYRLTMTYDNYTALAPYSDRVCSAFLLNSKSDEFFGITVPDINKSVFQIILDESIMQSGRSNSGGDYENRIATLFDYYGLKYDRHSHERDDASQEHDLLIEFKSKRIGVGAKRTLRERYKQYNPVEVDVSIVFTIGEDLNEAKANVITNNYKSYIFVSDEIYDQNEYMKRNKMVYKVTQFDSTVLDLIIGEAQ
jgi:hypothetical protein